MSRDNLSRRFLAALADASPAFARLPVREAGRTSLGRRFLAALADATPSFQPPDLPGALRGRSRRSGTTPPAPQPFAATSADERELQDRAVADLAAAVSRQWRDELARRSVRRTALLRVRWATTSRPVASGLSNVFGHDLPHRPRVVRGNSAEHLDTLLDSLQDRQLVILGEPGSGKTVLAMQFVLDLLDHRQASDPVPVMMPLSSWNPTAEDLPTWLARRIRQEYPAIGSRRTYGDAATAMVKGGRVVAVLDGLDEMPTSVLPTAIAALDRAAAAGYPMVVTCRSLEYQEAVTNQGTFLSQAAVVEMEPVDLADAGEYLIAATPAGSDHWMRVMDELAARPFGPLVRVLSSPLMITLAHTVYAAPGSAPEELLDVTRFTTSEEIESHLLDGFIRVAYPDVPATDPPPRARLAFLART